MTQKRDSHGRFKADHHKRNLAIGATTFIGAAAGLAGAALRFGLFDRLFSAKEGHEAPDLAADAHHPDGSGRAPDAFRPDGDAPVSDSDRESLRPATVAAPQQKTGVERLNGD